MSKLKALKESSIIRTKSGVKPFVNLKENVLDFAEIMGSRLYGKVEDFYDIKIYPHVYDRRLKKCAAICEKAGCAHIKEHSESAVNLWDACGKQTAMDELIKVHNVEEQTK